jgi:tetratricopeptide (TPR) repeat protein
VKTQHVLRSSTWLLLAISSATSLTISSVPANACLWDYDTLKEEGLGQAEVLAAVTGDLGKHSDAFFAAKINYTQKLLDAALDGKQSPDRYDDLAVAQARLGQLDAAMATLDAKDKVFPDQYTTAANRGTFLMLQGKLADADKWLRKAVAQKPDAHFGREKYQIMLLEYLQRLAKDPTLQNVETFLPIKTGGAEGFGNSDAIMAISNSKAKKRRPAPSEAVIAIAGIIRFGEGQQSPHVWWAFGWALVAQGDAQLAARAFRRAQLLGHPRAEADGSAAVSTMYGAKAGCCISGPEHAKQWAQFAAKADAEWAKGQKAQAKRQAKEDALITNGQLRKAFGY